MPSIPDPRIRLCLMGPTRLVGPDGREVGEVLRRPKLLAVLAYLAACRPPGFRERDELLALFWPEHDQTPARRALRKTLYRLRRALGPNAVATRGRHQVDVDRRVLWCDVPALREAVERGAWRVAWRLHRGELLPAFHVRGLREFGAWLETTRGELKDLTAKAGWALAEAAEGKGSSQVAVEWGRKALALASAFDEPAMRRFVALLDRCGCGAEALHVYQAFEERLSEELGVAPAPGTRALVAGVRTRLGDGRRR